MMRAPNLELPWYSSIDEDIRYKKILKIALAILVVFAIIIPLIPVPELTREERETLPPQLARVVLEKKELPKPPPPPPPKPKEEEKPKPVEEKPKPPEEKPKPKPEPKPEPPKPQPKKPAPVDKVAEAKKKAATSGLLQFKDDLADMRDALDVSKVETKGLSRGTSQAAKVDRSVITSGAKSTSGGINTAALSRDTGGVALSGRETTVVESSLANRAGSDAENIAGANGDGAGAGSSARSTQEIRRVIEPNKAALFAIYNRALRRNPSLQGEVVVKITIEPSGQISNAEIVSSDLNDPDLEKRILSRIRLIAFEASNASRTTVNYTFNFLPN